MARRKGRPSVAPVKLTRNEQRMVNALVVVIALLPFCIVVYLAAHP